MTRIVRWTIYLLVAIAIMMVFFAWATRGSYASASERVLLDGNKHRGGCVTMGGHDKQTVKGEKDAAFPPRVTFFTMTQVVTWSWDCHGNWTNGGPSYTRSFWQNNCVACQYQFKGWFAPETTNGRVDGCAWEKRVQKAKWDLNLAVYTQHKVFGVWQRVGAWAVLSGGGGYSEGYIT